MEMKRAAQEDTTVSAPILDLAKIFAIVIFFKFESDKKTKNVSLVQNLQCNKSKRGELQKKTTYISKPTITAPAEDRPQEWKLPAAQIVCEDISCGVIAQTKTDPHFQLKLGQCLLGL